MLWIAGLTGQIIKSCSRTTLGRLKWLDSMGPKAVKSTKVYQRGKGVKLASPGRAVESQDSHGKCEALPTQSETSGRFKLET